MTAPAINRALGAYVVICDEYLDQPFDAGMVRHLDVFQDRHDAEFYIADKDELTGGGFGFHAVPLSVVRYAPELLAALGQCVDVLARAHSTIDGLKQPALNRARAAIAKATGVGVRS